MTASPLVQRLFGRFAPNRVRSRLMASPDDPAQRRNCEECDQDTAQNIHYSPKPGIHNGQFYAEPPDTKPRVSNPGQRKRVSEGRNGEKLAWRSSLIDVTIRTFRECNLLAQETR